MYYPPDTKVRLKIGIFENWSPAKKYEGQEAKIIPKTKNSWADYEIEFNDGARELVLEKDIELI